jgi:hypothetical protein
MKLTFISFLFFSICFSQTEITLTPNSNEGKDAIVFSNEANTNYGNYTDFISSAWTFSGSPGTIRSLIQFDLTSIPVGSTINFAYLSLYSYNSQFNGSHSTLNGSNESIICRVTSPWDESTVTWNNQPSSNMINAITLSQSTNSIQDYLDNDITNMVQDMINNPSTNYGFLIKLVTEEYYRRMVFGSSDNPDNNLHPKLVINYTPSLNEIENVSNNAFFNIHPNPASDFLNIQFDNSVDELKLIEISNTNGQKIENILTSDSNVNLNISTLPKGIYFVNIKSENNIVTKKVLIK